MCQLADSSGVQAITRFENADRTIRDLREQLARAEARILEGEALRKRLHNTILVICVYVCVFYELGSDIPLSNVLFLTGL